MSKQTITEQVYECIKKNMYALEKQKIASLTGLSHSQITRACTILRKKGLIGFQRVHVKLFNSSRYAYDFSEGKIKKVKTYWGRQ